MRQHYGKNLFTTRTFTNSVFCSNFFNYKIELQDFSQFLSSYENAIAFVKDQSNCIEVNYDDILSKGRVIDEIENFIGRKVDRKIIKNK